MHGAMTGRVWAAAPRSLSSRYGLLASNAASTALAMLGRLDPASDRAVKMNCRGQDSASQGRAGLVSGCKEARCPVGACSHCMLATSYTCCCWFGASAHLKALLVQAREDVQG